MKFIDIYSKSQNIWEASKKFGESLGTIDEDGLVISTLQYGILNFTENYISDSKLLGKVIVEGTNMLFATIKPVDSLAYTVVTEAEATGKVLGETGLSCTDLYSGSFAVV